MAKASEASVQAMREQSEAMLRPYIVVAPFVRPHTPLLYLRVANVGRTAAQNVRLSLDKDFFQFGDRKASENNLRTMSAFSTPIDSFPPSSEIIFALAQAWVIFEDKADPALCPRQFVVTAIYDFSGKHVEELNRIDLRPYLGSEPHRDAIVEELERIRKVLEKTV
jgi:hypothetical protein